MVLTVNQRADLAPAVAISWRNTGDKRAINHFHSLHLTTWTQVQIVQQLVSQLPWSRNICIGNSPTACWTTAPPCPLSQQAAALFADGPSIGLILCKTKGKITAEYALRDVNKPLGISTYQLAEGLPADLKGQLHSIEALEEELARMDGDNDE